MWKSCDHTQLQQGSVKNLLEKKAASSDISGRTMFVQTLLFGTEYKKSQGPTFSPENQERAVDFGSIFGVSDWNTSNYIS